jgi:AcrR family transcriptional regulator
MASEAAILDVAYDLYAREGVDRVSMRRVAAKLGITATALYRHFDDKEALIEGVADRGFELFAAALRRPPVARAPRARILQILDRYRELAFRRPDLFRLMFSTPRPGLRRFPADFAAHRSRVFDELRDGVERGMARGEFRRASSLEVALSLWAHAHGLLALEQTGRFSGARRRFTALYRRLLRRHIRGV